MRELVDKRVTGQYHTICFYKRPSQYLTAFAGSKVAGAAKQGGPIADFSLNPDRRNARPRAGVLISADVPLAAIGGRHASAEFS